MAKTQPSLFDTPETRLLALLPEPVGRQVKPLFRENIIGAAELKADVEAYVNGLAEVDGEFLDWDKARSVARQCTNLLNTICDTTDRESYLLIQVAVRYFIQSEDAEGDIHSPIGFDDDELVVQAVAELVGLKHPSK